jgi:oxygen-dependent protoporphyrinogen oxidase
LFLSFKDGVERLVRALEANSPEVQIKLSTAAESVSPAQGWKIGLPSAPALEADAVCIALPSFQTAQLIRAAAPEISSELEGIPYESVATVNLAYQRTDVPHELDGFGFVVPAIAKRKIVACSFSSVKFSGRAPEGMVLLRAFVGGALHREVYALDDAALMRTVREELRHYLGIENPPLFMTLSRYPRTMPQYQVGHLNIVRSVQSKLVAYPGLFLAGNAYRGIGIPDCIHRAERTAEAMVQFLKTKKKYPGLAPVEK